MLLLFILPGSLSASAIAQDEKFSDQTIRLWRAAGSFEQLHACAGLSADDQLLLVRYEEVHRLPSGPAANDGGVTVTPQLQPVSAAEISIRTLNGRRLTLAEFRRQFETSAPNAIRRDEGQQIREHHALVIVLERGRAIPPWYRDVFRGNLPVIQIRGIINPPKRRARTGPQTDGQVVP